MSAVLLVVLIVVSGAGLSLQAAWNTRLREALGSPVLAPILSLVVSMIGLGLFEATGALPRGKLAFQGVPSWAFFGGLFGAVYLVVSVVALPKVGAGALIAATVLGQMVAALALDGTGAFGVERSPVSAVRIVGAVLVMAGVALVQYRK